MLRAYCNTWKAGEPDPELGREETHHLVRVRRVREGEEVEILNGRGDTGLFRVTGLDRRQPRLELVRSESIPPPPLRLHLFVALAKGKVIPAVLHKAVELGVARITPLLTENAEVEADRAENKRERWEAVLIEALKQSGNPWLPELDEPTDLGDTLASLAGKPALCAALQPDSQPLWSLLDNPLKPYGELAVFIGPEGDFSPGEYDRLRAAGCCFASLGPLVLKVETASSLVAGTLRLWSLGSPSHTELTEI